MGDEWSSPRDALLKAIKRTAESVGNGATSEDAQAVEALVRAYTQLLVFKPAERPTGDTPVEPGPGPKGVKEIKEIKELDKSKDSEAGFTPPSYGPHVPPTPSDDPEAHFIRAEHRPDLGAGS